MYYAKWKWDCPQLKVSRPAEDICQYCYTFADRHMHLARHSGLTPAAVSDDNASERALDDSNNIWLGCAFRRISAGFRRKLAKSHRQEKCESSKHRNALLLS